MTNIRRLLVPMDGSARDRAPLGAAFAVAVALGAHVSAMHVRLQPSETLPFVGEGMSAALVQEMVELTEREGAAHAAVARATFDEMRESFGVALRSSPGETGPSAQWFEEDALAEDAIAAAGRLSDLVVLPRPESSGSGFGDAAFGTALFQTGRPVLVSGSQAALDVGGHVVVAWDGGAEAARALGASLPFLARAAKTSVVTARGGGDGADEAAAVIRYLAWHGVAAEPFAVSPHPSVEEALLAATRGASLVVMGGYSHSRLRELILGGVTRYMVEKAAVPLLLAH